MDQGTNAPHGAAGDAEAGEEGSEAVAAEPFSRWPKLEAASVVAERLRKERFTAPIDIDFFALMTAMAPMFGGPSRFYGYGSDRVPSKRSQKRAKMDREERTIKYGSVLMERWRAARQELKREKCAT